MAVLPAKCPECGGLIEVDSEKKAANCKFWGCAFIVDEAINNFNTYFNITYNLNTTHNYGDGAVVNVYEDKTKDFVIEGGVLKKYQGESLTPVVPEGVVAIEGGAFENSTITKVTLPSTLKELRSCYVRGLKAPFSGCKYLEEVNLPEGLKEISINAFFDCISLTSITIPDSVTSLGEWVFRGCDNLTTVNISNILLAQYENAFPDSVLRNIRKSKGLCQHCGGKLKKDFIFSRCLICRKRKDY